MEESSDEVRFARCFRFLVRFIEVTGDESPVLVATAHPELDGHGNAKITLSRGVQLDGNETERKFDHLSFSSLSAIAVDHLKADSDEVIETFTIGCPSLVSYCPGHFDASKNEALMETIVLSGHWEERE